jgi:hypothetical protein
MPTPARTANQIAWSAPADKIASHTEKKPKARRRRIRGIVIDESDLIFFRPLDGFSVPRFCSDPLPNDPPLPCLFELGKPALAIRFERIEFV